MQRTLTASQLCSVNPSSFCLTLFNCEHHFSALLRPSLLFSILTTLFNSSQSFFHLFPPQLNSFHLFPALLKDSHLCPPLLNFSHLLPPLLNSSHLFSPPLNSSHFFLSSSQPFSSIVNFSVLASSSQIFSPLFTGNFRHPPCAGSTCTRMVTKVDTTWITREKVKTYS